MREGGIRERGQCSDLRSRAAETPRKGVREGAVACGASGWGSQESESGLCRDRVEARRDTGAGTYERDSVRWKRCRRPRNMTNELGGKERADTSQRGPSKAPPAGQWQRKPPSGPSAQVPPLWQTPGTQRPASVSSSQSSPRGQATVRGGHDHRAGPRPPPRPSVPRRVSTPLQGLARPASVCPRHRPALTTPLPWSRPVHYNRTSQPRLCARPRPLHSVSRDKRPLVLGGPRLSQGQALRLLVSPRPGWLE